MFVFEMLCLSANFVRTCSRNKLLIFRMIRSREKSDFFFYQNKKVDLLVLNFQARPLFIVKPSNQTAFTF